MNRGAIILCGGKSTRMGRDKALLPFGPREVVLQRVVRLVGEVVPNERIVCVAAPGQPLPPLPEGIVVARDRVAHLGPLAGLAAGLAELDESAAVFVAGCDAPRLHPALIERLFDLLGEHEAAAPQEGEQCYPLPAVYRASILPRARALLEAGERSLAALLARSDTRRVAADVLREADPELASLATCNTQDEYEAALRQCGLATSE